MANIIYPTTEKIIEYNLLVLEPIKIKRFKKLIQGHKKLLAAIGNL